MPVVTTAEPFGLRLEAAPVTSEEGVAGACGQFDAQEVPFGRQGGGSFHVDACKHLATALRVIR